MPRREAGSGRELLAQAPPTTPASRRPLILKERTKASKRVAEVAGGTTAECLAVVCCCPCGLVNLIVLAVVKIPVAIYRRAVRKRKKCRRAEGAAVNNIAVAQDIDIAGAYPAAAETGLPLTVKSPAAEVSEMEKVMWSQIFGTGFWRSPSQRE
ncbi:hypothetical protein KSP40_PGU003295 [Platanthera guangdongensis]|uniref:Uncharacterized protein n=1 Tax=Platanthera guangdongensis TaxID=2320717 RepID=A0ABR2MXH1_9ASPA